MSEAYEVLDQLKGEDLSAVGFVRDYLQLQFNPPLVLNAYNPVVISVGGRTVRQDEEAFASVAIAQIGKIVSGCEMIAEVALVIRFTDNSAISISLVPADYTCPEAAFMQGRDNRSIVWRIDDGRR